MTDSTSLRPNQEQILKYQSGKMGISAVPGSGKTWTLSLLAARIILSGALRPDQEVLIVTFANSAVDNFSHRISGKLKDAGLLPGIGYSVRTLHGLAHDILKERPDLAGLSSDFKIVDERETTLIKSRIANNYLSSSQDFLTLYGKPEDSDSQKAYFRDKYLPRLFDTLTNNFIRTAKDMQYSPADLKQIRSTNQLPLPLVDLGIQMYTDYQRALNYYNGVDFDDLIRLALQCLKFDPALTSNLRDRWPFILEDEAQDSSQLQQQILSMLSGEDGNWVRVGDPNQAIYETFTTADPRLLRDFIKRADVVSIDLPESGRSTNSIINLANFLINWTRHDHPASFAHSALDLPLVQPASPSDPQPNPPDNKTWIELVEKQFSPDEEADFIAWSAGRWLHENPSHTLVILAPTNAHGFKIIEALRQNDLPIVDSLLSSSNSTRLSAGAIAHILRSLAEPHSPARLAKALEVWRRAEKDNEEGKALTKKAVNLVKKCAFVEDYLWSDARDTWLRSITDDPLDNGVMQLLLDFRQVMQRWQKASALPVDQLILTISQDLFLEPGELAMAHKLALTLREMSLHHLEWELSELTEELTIIAKNERRFLGFSDDDTGFNPENYPGKVVVSTIHRAKGLEWDKVFLSSVSNYDFPSGTEYDSYFSERWFIRKNLNIEAEALEQLNILVSNDPFVTYTEGKASTRAREEFIRERLRLLYVGITRAKKALTITWNTGRMGTATEALPLVALRDFWRDQVNK